MNIHDLSPTAKSGCKRGSLTKDIDMIQLSSTILIKCLRYIALYIVKVSGEGTKNRPISWIILASFMFLMLSQAVLKRSSREIMFLGVDCLIRSKAWSRLLHLFIGGNYLRHAYIDSSRRKNGLIAPAFGERVLSFSKRNTSHIWFVGTTQATRCTKTQTGIRP